MNFYEKYFNCLKELLGLKKNYKLIHDPDLKILGNYDGENIRIKTFDNYKVLEVMTHEMYHAYQSEYLDEFKNMITNYIAPGEKGYDDQLIELQAVAFTHRVFLYGLGIKLFFPKELETKIKHVSVPFTDKQIKTVFRKYGITTQDFVRLVNN